MKIENATNKLHLDETLIVIDNKESKMRHEQIKERILHSQRLTQSSAPMYFGNFQLGMKKGKRPDSEKSNELSLNVAKVFFFRITECTE